MRQRRRRRETRSAQDLPRKTEAQLLSDAPVGLYVVAKITHRTGLLTAMDRELDHVYVVTDDRFASGTFRRLARVQEPRALPTGVDVMTRDDGRQVIFQDVPLDQHRKQLAKLAESVHTT